MLISLLPPLSSDQHRDCFRALLRSAFEVGYDQGNAAGAGRIALMILEAHDRKRS